MPKSALSSVLCHNFKSAIRNMPFNVFKCQFEKCCNFFTSISDRNRKYCGIHEKSRKIKNRRSSVFFQESINGDEKQW